MKKCYLKRVSEQRNILHEIRKRKANWNGHILCRNCLLKQVIEGKIKGQIEVTRRRGRRRKQLLDDLGDRSGYSHLKEEALDLGIVLEETVDLSSDRLLMNYDVCMYVCMYICIVCMYVYVCIYVFIVYVYICMCCMYGV
jgi:hypothetical protein